MSGTQFLLRTLRWILTTHKEEAAFRAEAAAWLKDNVPSADELAGLDDIAAAKLWQKA